MTREEVANSAERALKRRKLLEYTVVILVRDRVTRAEAHCAVPTTRTCMARYATAKEP